MDSTDFAQVLASVREFVRRRVLPLEQEIDDKDEIPATIQQAARDMGLFGFAIPEQYGGLGLSMVEESRLVMELGYTTPSLRSLFGTNNGIAGHTLLEGGTEEQKQEWLPRIASGRTVASFALTEAEAGSDPSDMRTSAHRERDRWVINGTKRYITNAPVAELFMTYARTDHDRPARRGISTFLVTRDMPGVMIGPRDHKMGQFGAWTADVSFDDVVVPHASLVGGDAGVHTGYTTAMKCLAHGRVHIAALCVGMIERALDESVGYASTRRQGGQAIGAFQLVQGLIADTATDLYAARALVLDVAGRFDDGTDRKVGPSTAKYFASEAVGRAVDRAVQIHGGAGYMRGVTVERLFRDARLFRIYEGTSQIQQVIIARALLGEAAPGQ